MIVRVLLAVHLVADACFVGGLLALAWIRALDPEAQEMLDDVKELVIPTAMWGALCTGGVMVVLDPARYLGHPWFMLKLALVVALFACHGALAKGKRAGRLAAVVFAGLVAVAVVRPWG